MHKVLFFIYALFYKKYKKELWKPEFEAWKYGPVETNYRKSIKNDNYSINNPLNIESLTTNQLDFLNDNIQILLKTSVWELVDYSHSNNAYKFALENNKKILNEHIQKINFKNKNTKYDIKNILGNQKTNNEFYTPKEPIIDLINKLEIPKDKVIWCPFDEGNSQFVIQLREYGYKVINSHINNGQDFHNWTPKEKWDLIISNPPFTKKRSLIERCESLGKDFCLLYGAKIFSQSMGNTLNRLKFWFIQNNIKFTTITNETKSFQCYWIMNKEFKYLKD